MDSEEHRSDNITYTQAGVSCFVGQESRYSSLHTLHTLPKPHEPPLKPKLCQRVQLP